MKKLSCCVEHSRRAEVGKRGIAQAASVVFSSLMLIAMPKCPVCMAAYVALMTGISISAAAASHLRLGLFVVCLSVLGGLVLHGLCKRYRGRCKRLRR
ncbi:hypothetical protein [Prosthecobacter dejongeii]|uniref:Uncharacterized protein n=1 Tax=Prosthecobacter dejongeii TaxID=48465 RepID=A0A7W8DP61_9BACT|nr:hypothetical protein [Prosthecobacter dejongeii]MBB5036621.1 hypothetical protein [Prosthecobacter dejongeii]